MPKKRIRQIAVIGTINRDTVVQSDGSRSQGYGGILYNLIVLSRLGGDRLRILPVANLGSDHDKQIRAILQKLPQVQTDALRTVNSKNNHCLLQYQDASNKTEKLSGWVGSVSRRQLQTALKSDHILVNYISGSDISTSNLFWLRDHSTARIYMDFHSRTLGRRRDGTRYLRRPRDWRSTVQCADYLQMNELEFRLLTGKEPSPEYCRRFFGDEMSGMAQALLITLGSDGCVVCCRRGSKVVSQRIKPVSQRKVIDTTGCGDVFAAAFLSALTAGVAILGAARFAVSVATFRAESDSVEDINFGRFQAVTLP